MMHAGITLAGHGPALPPRRAVPGLKFHRRAVPGLKIHRRAVPGLMT